MKLTNDSYLILIGTKNFSEQYYRDKDGWLKVSARGKKFRMTAEQVLNHVLPAMAGVNGNLFIKVEHREVLKKRAEVIFRKPLKRLQITTELEHPSKIGC